MSSEVGKEVEEDWETIADTGNVEGLGPVKEAESTEKSKLHGFRDTTTPEVSSTKKADEITSFDDILCPRNKSEVPESKGAKRPETTPVVARRMLAHALQKPELINRKEESELRERRVENKKAREQRRKDLDSVWD